MDIYHSFWDKGWNSLDENLYNMHKLSVLTALKNYGNIHLITTEEGKKFLGDLPYTSIEIYEEELPIHLKDAWSLSKIYAYKQIAKKNRPFFHIDYDVFLFKRLPEYYENSEIIYQHVEKGTQVDICYGLDEFHENCSNKYLGHTSNREAYNMAIFGGQHIEAVKFYSDEAIKLLNDENNIERFWRNFHLKIPHCARAVLLEQWYVKCCMDHLGVNAVPLLQGHHLDNEGTALGYCHVWGSKHDQTIHEKIKRKILKLETELV